MVEVALQDYLPFEIIKSKYLHSRNRVTEYLPFQIIKLCDGKVGLLVLLDKKDA